MAYSPHPPAGDTTDAVLAIRNLSVEVAGAGNRVVRNLSLDVHAGETVCVVGESGSGKSVSSLAVMGRSEEHTSELQSLMRISYAVFCLKKTKHTNTHYAQY